MSSPRTLILVAVAASVGLVLVLYAAHRFALWLESRGLLFYRDRKPSGNPMAGFVQLQQMLEPGTQHVASAEEPEIREDGQGPPADPAGDIR